MNKINLRKQQHLHIMRSDPEVDRGKNYFDDYPLTHRAIPSINLGDVDTRCCFLGKTLAFPFLISSMTGGDSKAIQQLNQQLAEVAEVCQVGMGVGSQRIMLGNSKAEASFKLRRFAPSVPLIANLGAVQLNDGIQFADIQRLLDTLEADALYLHFNALQEAVQPNGDTNFAGLMHLVERLVDTLPVPVIAKEVGSGFSREDLQQLADAGITWVDVAGSGGTSWSRIEGHRHEQVSGKMLGEAFQDWGIPTPQAIQIAHDFGNLNIIASGGIRDGVDILKSLVLGAQVAAAAAPVFHAVENSQEACEQLINGWQQQLKTGLFLLDCRTPKQLTPQLLRSHY